MDNDLAPLSTDYNDKGTVSGLTVSEEEEKERPV